MREYARLNLGEAGEEEVVAGLGLVHAWISGSAAGRPEDARPALERAMAAARETRQLSALAQSLSMASIAEGMAGGNASARRLLDEAQVVTAGLDDVFVALGLLQARALGGLFEGDLDAVRSASSEGTRLSRGVGDLYSPGMMLLNQGSGALLGGDLDGSKPLFAEALGIAHQIMTGWRRSTCSAPRAATRPRRAAAAGGAAARGQRERPRRGGRERRRAPGPPAGPGHRVRDGALGPTRFDAEVRAGTRYSGDAAVGLALGEREEEVAWLVADGLSNKQIGARLSISERTVESHGHGILNKLGFNSRTQIAGWMASPNQ